MGQSFSGSTIKSWFQYRCERKTRYEIMDPTDLAAVEIAKRDGGAWADFGVGYEDRVVSALGKGNVVRPSPGRKGLSEAQTKSFLRGDGGAQYADQMNLRPVSRPSLLSAVPEIAIRPTFPDLIHRELSGPAPLFTVIDIKATRSARAFHKTQVAFYVRLLQAMIGEVGAAGAVNEQTGFIWRIPDDGDGESSAYYPEPFDLKPYLRLVDDFCEVTLPKIASKTVLPGQDETFFHVYFKCEQCDYLDHCHSAVDASKPAVRRDISAVAGLTHESKRTLQSVGIRSVAQLAQAGAGIGKVDGAGWSLSRRAEILVSRAKALVDDRIAPGLEPHTFLMPPVSEVALYLVVDHDPVDDGLVTLGYLYVEGGTARERIEVLPTSSRAAEADALVGVFTDIISDLEAVDRRNAALPEDQGVRAHIYFYEVAEATSLQDAVKRHLDDPRVRGGLLHMVRLFPPDEVVPEPEFRGMQHLPATPLRSVVEQLFAVPTTVSYDLRQVSQALAREGAIAHPYAPEEGFARPFSSLLSIEISRGMREERRDAVSVEEVRSDVSSRLGAARSIAEWLQDEHRRRVDAGDLKMLRLNKKPFALQATFNPLEAGDLDVLRAFELLENRSGLLESLVRLAQPNHVRRDAGRAVGPMRLLHASPGVRDVLLRFAIPQEAQESEISSGTFGLVLTDGQPDLLLEPRLWPRLACQLKPKRAADGPDVISVTVYRRVFDSPDFQEMMRRAGQANWWLDQTFVDINSSKADDFLSYLAAGAAA
jgi:hypothetical protein